MRKPWVYIEGMDPKQKIAKIPLSANTNKNSVLHFLFLSDRRDYSDLVFCTAGWFYDS